MHYIQLSHIKSHTVVVYPSFHYSSYKLPTLLKTNSTTKQGSFPTVLSALQRHNQQDTTVVITSVEMIRLHLSGRGRSRTVFLVGVQLLAHPVHQGLDQATYNTHSLSVSTQITH